MLRVLFALAVVGVCGFYIFKNIKDICAKSKQRKEKKADENQTEQKAE